MVCGCIVNFVLVALREDTQKGHGHVVKESALDGKDSGENGGGDDKWWCGGGMARPASPTLRI